MDGKASSHGTRLWTPKECATYWGVAETTIRTWFARGHLRGTKFGSRVYVPEAEVARVDACEPVERASA